jgi:hypothetical protein
MAGEYGIKETKESMKGILALVEFIIERLDDGAGFDDVVAAFSKFTSDDVFKNKVKVAWEGREIVSKELSELDTAEMMELGMTLAPDIIAILNKMKK